MIVTGASTERCNLIIISIFFITSSDLSVSFYEQGSDLFALAMAVLTKQVFIRSITKAAIYQTFIVLGRMSWMVTGKKKLLNK